MKLYAMLLCCLGFFMTEGAFASDAGRVLCTCDIASAINQPGLSMVVAAEDVGAWMAPRSGMIQTLLGHTGLYGGDTLTVCNAKLCIDLQVVSGQASQGWVVGKKGVYPDNGGGYKNAGVGSIGGSPTVFFVAITEPDAFTGLPQVTHRFTICGPELGCIEGQPAVDGTSLVSIPGFGKNFAWSGDTNANDFGGPSYSYGAGYNSHGTVNGAYYGGVGIYNGSGYGNSTLAPGDTTNLGNGGLPTIRRDNY